MAITFRSAHSADTTSVAITTPASGDVIVVFAMTSTAAEPSLAAGFTLITFFAGADTGGAIAGFKISNGSETTSGTWSGADSVVAMIYRGTASPTPISGFATFDSEDFVLDHQIFYESVVLSVDTGSSWVAGAALVSGASAGMDGTTTGLPSNRTHLTDVNGLDTNGGVSSFSRQTLSYSGFATAVSITVELLAAAGASLSASDSEAAAATDMESATLATSASDSEAASAADSESDVASFAGTDAEAGTATDSESGTSSLAATESEAATAGDSQTATLSTSASESEAGVASDSESAAGSFVASDSEAATATDTETTTLAAKATGDETASASDSETAAMSAVASDSEAATASDVESASRGQSAADSESASAADSSDAVQSINFLTSSAFPDYTPDTIACGSRYRMELLWGPPSRHARGGPQFTAFRKFRRPRHAFELAWSLLTKNQAFHIDAHVRALSSTLFPFHWFDWYPWWWRSVLVGIGDGATTQWVLPAKDVTDVTIFVGGATSSGGTDRLFIGGNIAYRIGPELEDGVDLFAPPAAGRPVWAYFRGRRRFDVRYANDLDQPLTRDLETGLYNVALKLVQTKILSGS